MGDRIDDFFTFAVCATDIDETRTDNIMVVAFDTKKHTVNVMNIPRDTMSNVNRTGAGRKINAAYGTKNGIEQTKKQIKQVMGFTPDKYMVVNFNGIEAEIVDAIGGVDYDIPFPMMYKDPVQKLEINFPTAGSRHLNGEEVVEFLRWRKIGTGYTKYVPAEYKNGDETRIKKQQEFLMYLAKEVLTIKNAPNYKKIADAVFKNVKTDITAGEMIWLAGQAFQVDTTNGVELSTMPGYSAMSTAGNSTELSFFFINEGQALKLINEYFNPYDQKITGLDLVSSRPRDRPPAAKTIRMTMMMNRLTAIARARTTKRMKIRRRAAAPAAAAIQGAASPGIRIPVRDRDRAVSPAAVRAASRGIRIPVPEENPAAVTAAAAMSPAAVPEEKPAAAVAAANPAEKAAAAVSPAVQAAVPRRFGRFRYRGRRSGSIISE